MNDKVKEIMDKYKCCERTAYRCKPTKAAREAMAAWQAKFIKIKKHKVRKEAA